MLKGYKTLIVNGLVAVGTALAAYLATPEVTAAFAAHPQALVIGVAVLNIGLRFLTNSAVGSKV